MIFIFIFQSPPRGGQARGRGEADGRMDDILSIFREYLKSRGIHHSDQREEVLAAFLDSEHHMTMAQLHDRARARNPRIGFATTYRAMRLIRDAGLADEIDFGDGAKRYDHTHGHRHHDHIICETCGECLEIDDPEIERLQERLADKLGFSLTGHKLYLRGVCGKCRSSQALARKTVKGKRVSKAPRRRRGPRRKV